MRTLSLLLVFTAVAALRLPARDIQRLNRDDPVPAGWRLATVDDVTLNSACFNLVLKGWQIAEIANGYKVAGWGYTNSIEKMVRACAGCSDPGLRSEQPGHKVVVSFGEDTVLGRERTERNVRRAGDVGCRLFLITKLIELSVKSFKVLASQGIVQAWHQLQQLLALADLGVFIDLATHAATSGTVSRIALGVAVPIGLRSAFLQQFYGSI